MRLRYPLLFLLLPFLVLVALPVKAQSQLLLPYNDWIFQSTWENPAVRPIHRFSIGLPAISSIYAGFGENLGSLDQISKYDEKKGQTLFVPSKIQERIKKGSFVQVGAQASIDLLHFRFAWRDWYFWLAARNNTSASYMLGSNLLSFILDGNSQFIGQNYIPLKGIYEQVYNYHEFTFGFSKVREKYSFGFRASYLMGTVARITDLTDMQAKVSKAFDEDGTKTLAETSLVANGFSHTSGIPSGGLLNPSLIAEYFVVYDSINKRNTPGDFFNKKHYLTLKNPGFALSAAATYTPLPGLDLTLSVTDIGMIHWGGDATISASTDTISYKEVVSQEKFKESINNNKLSFGMKDLPVPDINGLLDTDTTTTTYNLWLPAKMHFLIAYELPSQTRFGASFSGAYMMGHFLPSAAISIQQSYSNIFSVQLSAAYHMRSWMNFGFGLIFSPGPIQFYLITDNFFAAIDPFKFNSTNVRVGINIVLGPKYPSNRLTYR